MPELRNTLLIARREYRERARTRSFVVMTILIPAMMGGLIFGSAWINNGGTHHALHLGGHYPLIAAVYFLFFLMYMSVTLYGVAVARSISEEKSSRIFEVLLSAATSGELMAGKVLGVGSVGLTQVGIWIAAGLLLGVPAIATPLIGGPIHLPIGLGGMLFFALMYSLGFLFYASIAAILGSIVNSDQELSQLNFFIVLPLIALASIIGPVIMHPDGHLATVASFIPCWTPLVLFARVAAGHVPLWQILASIATLVLAIALLLWAAARIYRIGILMVGKRPTPAQLLRWLRSN
jgi:ABC-2 type transport system permease protein